MRVIIGLSAALCLGAVLAGSADAQLTGYYTMGSGSPSLDNGDFMQLVDAANGLLRRSPLPVGATASWRNDKTGSTGTVRVTKTTHQKSMLCHTLVYETLPAGTPPSNRTTLNWCNTGEGWKILS